MKNKTLSLLVFGITCAVIFASTTFTKPIAAQSTTNPYSGVCAGIFNLTNPVNALYEYKNNSMDREGLNASIYIDFTLNKATMVINELVINGSDSAIESTVISQMAMTLVDYAPLPGSKKIIIDAISQGDNDITFVVLPVNSGNTFLVQGMSFGSTGVCQKL